MTRSLDLTEAARSDIALRTPRGRSCRRAYAPITCAKPARSVGTVKTPRHVIAYLTPTSDSVLIVRILHDAMELERHLVG